MRLVAAQNATVATQNATVAAQVRLSRTRGYTTGVDLESRGAHLHMHPVMPLIHIMELYPLEVESFVRI